MTPLSFGEAAERLCGAAAMLLGWRPADFWESTPAELQTAFRGVEAAPGGLDAETLNELRRRFPDR